MQLHDSGKKNLPDQTDVVLVEKEKKRSIRQNSTEGRGENATALSRGGREGTQEEGGRMPSTAAPGIYVREKKFTARRSCQGTERKAASERKRS